MADVKTLDEHAAEVERRNDVPLDRAYANILAAYEAERAARVALEARVRELEAEAEKAREAMGNGTDDSRWRPGETAVDALIRERDAERSARQDLLRTWDESHIDLAERTLVAEARVRELEADQDQAAQAVVDAQASEVAWKDRADKAEATLAETRAQLARLREAAENAASTLEHLLSGDDGCVDDAMGCALRELPALRAALSTPGPTLAEIEAAARAPVEAQLAGLREAVKVALQDLYEERHTCPVCDGGDTDDGCAHETDCGLGALEAALSTPGPTLAEIRRAAQVEVLRGMTARTLELGVHTTPFTVAEWLRRHADDLEAGRE